MDAGALVREVKQPGRDVNQSPTSSVKDKNEWSYISTSPIRRHDVNRDVALYKQHTRVWVCPTRTAEVTGCCQYCNEPYGLNTDGHVLTV
jgi:hypothetical protein